MSNVRLPVVKLSVNKRVAVPWHYPWLESAPQNCRPADSAIPWTLFRQVKPATRAPDLGLPREAHETRTESGE